MISIRARLTRQLVVVLLILEAAGGTALYFAAQDPVYDAFDEALNARAEAVSTLTTVTTGGVRVAIPETFFKGVDGHKPRDFFEIWDAAGRVLARSDSLEGGDLPRRTGLAGNPGYWELTLPDGHPARAEGFVFQPPAVPGGVLPPPLTLVVASRISHIAEDLWEVVWITVGTALVIFAATLLVVPRVLRRGLRPLDTLGEQMGRIQADALSERVTTGGLPPELAPIAERVNALLARLELSFERERRFSADLAHELRTPVAELKSAAEIALRWPDARDSQTDRDVLAVANHMESLVTHMLAVSRGESRLMPIERVPIDLKAEVENQWAKVDLAARAESLTPILALEAITVDGDVVMLRSILTNLFDNAVDYARRPGSIEVSITQDDHATRIRVGNSAPELEMANLPQLFERFWRKEAARTGGRHLGLGLPLAREMASALGWALTADLRADQWLSFTLAIPRHYVPAFAESSAPA